VEVLSKYNAIDEFVGSLVAFEYIGTELHLLIIIVGLVGAKEFTYIHNPYAYLVDEFDIAIGVLFTFFKYTFDANDLPLLLKNLYNKYTRMITITVNIII
jgi:hypothetical protein